MQRVVCTESSDGDRYPHVKGAFAKLLIFFWIICSINMKFDKVKRQPFPIEMKFIMVRDFFICCFILYYPFLTSRLFEVMDNHNTPHNLIYFTGAKDQRLITQHHKSAKLKKP